MEANSVTDLETDEDKLTWIFMAFDQDGGGFIDCKGSFSQGAIGNLSSYLAWSISEYFHLIIQRNTNKYCFSLRELFF